MRVAASQARQAILMALVVIVMKRQLDHGVGGICFSRASKMAFLLRTRDSKEVIDAEAVGAEKIKHGLGHAVGFQVKVLKPDETIRLAVVAEDSTPGDGDA